MIASLGTALTDQQVKLLGRYTRRIVVNYDPDSAGINATKRSLELLLEGGFKINVLSLPDGHDPDEYVLKHGGSAYKDLLKKSKPYMDYIIDQSIKEHDMTRPAGKAEAVNVIIPYLNKIKDRVELSAWPQIVGDRMGIDSKVVRDAMRRAIVGRQDRIDESAFRMADVMLHAERELLGIVTNCVSARQSLFPTITENDFSGLRGEHIFKASMQLDADGSTLDFGSFNSWFAEQDIEDEELTDNLLPTVLFDGALMVESRTEDELILQAHECLVAIRRKQMQQELDQTQIDIQGSRPCRRKKRD